MQLPLWNLEALVPTLGWTLVHFFWQGALLGLVAATALRLTRHRSPRLRYAVSGLALLLLAAAPVVTLGLLAREGPAATELLQSELAFQRQPTEERAEEDGSTGSASALAVGARSDRSPLTLSELPPAPWGQRLRSVLAARLDGIVLAWLVGALLFSLRSAGGWWRTHRLTLTGTSPVPGSVERQLARVAWRLGVRRTVRLLRSARVRVPTVVGWLRPVVLLPASALTGLAPWQLEALLAHELAHIRRHDYLVNLLQTVVESLLFFHPAVWWVSAQLRREREHCCDDLAVGACGGALRYARALERMELIKRHRPRRQLPGMALAADGGQLLPRIRRLLLPGEDTRRAGGAVPALSLIAVLSVSLVAWWPSAIAAPATSPSSQSGTFKGTWIDGDERQTVFDLDGRGYRVEQRGEVTLDPELRRIESLTDGGRLSIETSRRGPRRELVVRSEGGRLSFDYWVGGTSAPFDAAAEDWLGELLPMLMRRAGVGARSHAAYLVREGRTAELDREIERLESNSVRRIFFETWLVEGDLGPAESERLARRATRTIESNSTNAALLMAAHDAGRLSGSQVIELAAEAIESNSTMAGLLRKLVERQSLTARRALAVAAERIDSSSTRAALVVSLATREGVDLREDELIAYVGGLSSNSAIASTLRKLRDAGALDAGTAREVARRKIESSSTLASYLVDDLRAGSVTLDELFDAAGSIDSNSTLASLIVTVAEERPDDPQLGAALRRGLSRIDSDSALSRVLLDLRQRDVLETEEVLELAGRRIGSNSTLAELLRELLAEEAIDGRRALAFGAQKIGSSSALAGLIEHVATARRNEPGIERALLDAIQILSSDSRREQLLRELRSQGLLQGAAAQGGAHR